MRKTEKIWECWTERADLYGETMPGQSLVEINGDRTVLIENHGGIKVYTEREILVNVKYGLAGIYGSDLEIASMCTETLVIKGRIEKIELRRRD